MRAIASARREFKRQIEVAGTVAARLAHGDERIVGVMVERRQDLVPGQPLGYVKSITDACLGWDDSLRVLETLAQGVRSRRLVKGPGANSALPGFCRIDGQRRIGRVYHDRVLERLRGC